jgi:hypothetical protein
MIDLDAIRARDAEMGDADVRFVRKSLADRRALLAYVDELLAELNEQAANESSAYAKRLAAIEHGGVCIWCGDAIELTGKDMASAVEWARKHDAECPDNPLRSRLAEAEALLREASDVLCDAQNFTGPTTVYRDTELMDSNLRKTREKIRAHLAREP